VNFAARNSSRNIQHRDIVLINVPIAYTNYLHLTGGIKEEENGETNEKR
jgi:hypothetical protein